MAISLKDKFRSNLNPYLKQIAASISSKGYKYTKEWHVSTSGSDTTGTGAIERPFLTISKAIASAGNTGEAVIIHRGTFTEDIVVNKLNLDIVGAFGTSSGTVNIAGTITIANTSSSNRLKNIRAMNIVHSGACNLYVLESQFTGTITKSGSGYCEFMNCDLQGTGISVTGAGQTVFISGKQSLLTVNNTNAVVSVNDSDNLAICTVTAGTLSITDSVCFAGVAAGVAISSALNTNVYLFNSQVHDVLGAKTKLNLLGNYSINNCIYDASNSTLGTNLGNTAYFDKIQTKWKTWIEYATGFTEEPTLLSSVSGIEIYKYQYSNEVLYRKIDPQTKIDAFYIDSNLTILIAQKSL